MNVVKYSSEKDRKSESGLRLAEAKTSVWVRVFFQLIHVANLSFLATDKK